MNLQHVLLVTLSSWAVFLTMWLVSLSKHSCYAEFHCSMCRLSSIEFHPMIFSCTIRAYMVSNHLVAHSLPNSCVLVVQATYYVDSLDFNMRRPSSVDLSARASCVTSYCSYTHTSQILRLSKSQNLRKGVGVCSTPNITNHTVSTFTNCVSTGTTTKLLTLSFAASRTSAQGASANNVGRIWVSNGNTRWVFVSDTPQNQT